MGLAASQGRLLLLTARKSDLEFMAQKISQERLLLAMQSEQISNEYNDKISNQVWVVNSQMVGGSADSNFIPVTASALLAMTYATSEGTSTARYKIFNTSTGSWVSAADVASEDAQTFTQKYDSGIYLLYEYKPEATTADHYVSMSLSGNATFQEKSYTDDDAAAKSKYDAAMARIQRLDKQLELKLNQVETQKKAVETEIESVNKIISNNIESTFKYFS